MIDSTVPMSALQLRSIQESSGRVNIWSGSVRSGKTIASLLRWMIYVATTSYHGQLAVIARTRDSAFRNVFSPMMNRELFGPLADHVHYTSGAATAVMFGRTVHVFGASDAKAEKVLRGFTCCGAYVDELTVIPYDFFAQLLNRLWGLAQLFGTTNPDNPAHWLKVKYLDRLLQLPDWRHWKFHLDDNPALSEDNKASIRRENVGLFYRRYVLGEWVAAEGAIFPMWDPDVHTVPWLNLPEMHRLIGIGIDYGTTNASTGLMLGLGVDRRLYLVDEWRVDPKVTNIQLTDGQQSASFREWLTKPHLPYLTGLKPEWIIADPAGASFRTQLFNDGITTMAADNEVLPGIRTMATLIAAGQLLVADHCPGFIQEMPGYSWDSDATDKGEDKPAKVNDHSLDGGRYVIHTTREYWRRDLQLQAA